MTWYILIDFGVAILFIVLAALALTNGRFKSSQNRTFAGISFCLLIWLVTNQISNDVHNSTLLATRANYLLFAASFATAILAVRLMTQITKDKKVTEFLKFIGPIMWFFALIFGTPLVGKGVEKQGDVYGVVFGPLGGLYGFMLVCIISVLVWVVLKNWNHKDVHIKQQVHWVGTSLAITAPLVLLLGFLVPYFTQDFRTAQISLTPTIFFVFALYRSIARHGLFDVRLAAVRTTAYIMSLSLMAAIYFGMAYIASATIFKDEIINGVSMSPLNIVLALLLAFVFQPIRQFFDRWTNKIFYRDQYDTNEFIARLGRILTSTTKLYEILHLAEHEITTTMKASGSIFIVYRDHHPDVIVGTKLDKNFTQNEYHDIKNISHKLDNKVLSLMSHTEYNDNTETHRLYRLLIKKGVALVLPLVSAEEGVIGYLLLGEQLGSGYTKRDIDVLETIADELVIAIMNARSVQVVRDLNTHLEQRVEAATQELRRSNQRLLELDATKDEFLSMASHQLRTPLTSVKGYISMVLEGDVGKISEPQRQLLGEAFMSSERMVHLISDFLNVSRLQTGKFIIDPQECDLAEIVSQEVVSITQIAKRHGMSVVYKQPKRFPLLYVDDGKLRQVIMNFMDNAIYYSPDTKQIKITLDIEDGNAVFRVIDKGMGVPAEVQKRLFTKFFRAENARKQRPDGTGIGLYLAKKVIDGHGGNLLFESIEGKGSTFGFRLPIKKLTTPPPNREP